jgi:hypothetical protein
VVLARRRPCPAAALRRADRGPFSGREKRFLDQHLSIEVESTVWPQRERFYIENDPIMGTYAPVRRSQSKG